MAEATVTMRYDGEAPRRVRHGYRVYEGQPGATIDVNAADEDLLREHGWTNVATEAATEEVGELNATELVAGLRDGSLDVDTVETAERGRTDGGRKTVLAAIAEARAGTGTDGTGDDAGATE